MTSNQGEHFQEIGALQAEILQCKKQLQETNYEKGKVEYKLQTANQSLETSQEKVKELEKTLHQMEQLSTSQNNKLLHQKLSKDDLIRKVGDLELRIKKKQDELEEVKGRFDEHMQSNQRTERSLHERIADM